MRHMCHFFNWTHSRKSLLAAWLSHGILAVVLAFATSAADLRYESNTKRSAQDKIYDSKNIKNMAKNKRIIFLDLPVIYVGLLTIYFILFFVNNASGLSKIFNVFFGCAPNNTSPKENFNVGFSQVNCNYLLFNKSAGTQ